MIYKTCKCGQYHLTTNYNSDECPKCYNKRVHPRAHHKIVIRVLVTAMDCGLELEKTDNGVLNVN